MMRLPSVATIQATFALTNEKAVQVRKVLADVAVEWRPGMNESQKLLIDCMAYTGLDTQVSPLIGGHGVEVIHARTSDGALYYVNMGDPYRPTMMFDCQTLQFRVGAWGDMVEKYPSRFGDA